LGLTWRQENVFCKITKNHKKASASQKKSLILFRNKYYMTEQKRPLILVTNDDGIDATGINRLIETLRPLGDIFVVAPDGPRSGMSGAFTFTVPIRCRLVRREEGFIAYSCTGTPVDCVKLAVHQLLDRTPDLLVSGINHGTNSAICIFYSATVGAMFEGCIQGIPSIAVSLCDHSPDADFGQAIKFAKAVTEKTLQEGLPKGICLNLNIPVGEVKGMKVCSQTDSRWIKEIEKKEANDGGEPEYWLTGELFNDEPHNRQCDEWALANGFAALVPLRLDMTDYEQMKRIKNWEF
jgi:5'-nucleotidase